MSKKLASMSSLSQFSGIKPSKSQTNTESEDSLSVGSTTTSSTKADPISSNSNEKLVHVNIKITKTQKDWLNETAFRIRDNNQNPVPPNERVYPQHLINVAISLLQATGIDWTQIKSEQDLRSHLNL